MIKKFMLNCFPSSGELRGMIEHPDGHYMLVTDHEADRQADREEIGRLEAYAIALLMAIEGRDHYNDSAIEPAREDMKEAK